MKVFCILVLCFAVIGWSTAREVTHEAAPEDGNLVTNSTNNSDRSDASGGLIDARKRKPYHDLFLLARKSGFSTVHVKPLHGIAFMGGLQSLVGFVIIKIKIILLTVAIIGAAAVALKVFGVLKYSGFFYKNDNPPFAPPPEFHGYPGPPPYPPISHDHDTYGNDWPSYAEHYARSTGHQFPMSMNMTEIMYSVMHADRDDCRARLVCELEMMMTRSPFFNYFMSYETASAIIPKSLGKLYCVLRKVCQIFREAFGSPETESREPRRQQLTSWIIRLCISHEFL